MHFLGKNIRYLRKQFSKTQSDLAAVIRKGQTTIGNWENGFSEPSLEDLLLLSNFFDISTDILLKVDLSRSGVIAGGEKSKGPRVAARDYALAGQEASPIQEEDAGLSYVLQEISALRTEIAHIHARLPNEPPEGA
jgi:transcriptional regulator with XRE-family HTH domain